MNALKNRIALVTGASRGIGAAVAKAYAREGAHVILLARTAGALEAVDDEIRQAGGTATLMPLDLMKFKDIDSLGPAIADRFGRLDIFVGNAGILGTLTPLPHMAARAWEEVMVVNYAANFRLIRTLDPVLKASDAGRVIFTTAAMAHKPMAYWGAYAASKAALDAMMKTYAAENLKTPVRVNAVDPGVVDTALLREAFPGGFQGPKKNIEDVAALFIRLASPGHTGTGEIVKV